MVTFRISYYFQAAAGFLRDNHSHHRMHMNVPNLQLTMTFFMINLMVKFHGYSVFFPYVSIFESRATPYKS